jgi:hypothetical protein
MNLKLTNIKPDDYILAVKAAKSFIEEGKPIGIRHGTVYAYGYDGETGNYETMLYVYRVKTGIVVRYSY